NGHVLDEWFGKTVIHSDCRFTYEEAQEIIEKKDHTRIGEDLTIKLQDSIIALDKIAKKMRAKKFTRGSISFDKREVSFKLDENNRPIGINFKVSKDSNKLIEEYMLLANRRVAQYIKSKGPCVNRAHEEPD